MDTILDVIRSCSVIWKKFSSQKDPIAKTTKAHHHQPLGYYTRKELAGFCVSCLEQHETWRRRTWEKGWEGQYSQENSPIVLFLCLQFALWDDASACVPTPLLLSTNGAYNCSRMEELFGLAN
jgi:hypothetical protein